LPAVQLPKAFELVGLGYSAWFTYRYLLFKSSREELVEDIESLKKKIRWVLLGQTGGCWAWVAGRVGQADGPLSGSTGQAGVGGLTCAPERSNAWAAVVQVVIVGRRQQQ